MKHHYQMKKSFYSKLNLEDITDKDYAHAQKVWEVFEIKYQCEYHETWSCPFLIHTRISMASLFQKDKGKIRVITDLDMLLMVEEGIRGGM